MYWSTLLYPNMMEDINFFSSACQFLSGSGGAEDAHYLASRSR